MKSMAVNIVTIFGISIVVFCGMGCKRAATSSAGSVTVAGREIAYSIDGPSSVSGTDPLVIHFGTHKLEKQGGNFLLDGRNIGGIGGNEKIELVVSNSVLTMRSGSTTVAIPITR